LKRKDAEEVVSGATGGKTKNGAATRVFESILATKSITENGLLRHDAIRSGLGETLDSIHRLARVGAAGFQPELSATALQALAICARPDSGSPRISSLQQAVLEPVNVEELAKHLGVAYSHFRRAFREHTGFAPWQYVIQLRLAHARRLLASSPAKLEDVAARVGFSSGFHLSLAFKRSFGISPAHWRKSLKWRTRESAENSCKTCRHPRNAFRNLLKSADRSSQHEFRKALIVNTF